ncbi:MAG: beta-hydroxyacyl-ACP dehydratase [Thermoguttaceae bacterium]|nr:beta-hydroxyacyl-ACP dehydratase [Thermoguttaceae bacterium]MDW8079942.1 3-hydroxyacyl-ACP dehydratase FabZ family protein [Thermoguttaceae bacterium]
MDIRSLLPHREPFLFVDNLVAISDRHVIAEKTFTGTEAFFAGHFPDMPIVPGVLLCECAFQAAAAWLATVGRNREKGPPDAAATSPAVVKLAPQESRSYLPVVTRASDIQFRQPVYPGDTVRIEVSLEDMASNAYRFVGRIFKNQKLAVRLEFICMLVDKSALVDQKGQS